MSFQKSMITSKFFIIGFMLCANITTSASQLSHESVISTYQGKDGSWQYLEYLFVTQPKNKLNQLTSHGFSSLGAVGAATLGLKLGTNFDVSKDSINNLIVVLSAIAAGSTVYNYFLCYTNRTVQRETLLNVLENWQTHRHHIPLAFVECLDELYVAYQEQGPEALSDTLVSQTFELVRHHLEHYFSGRYKPEEVKKETTLSNIKSITDVMKNLG